MLGKFRFALLLELLCLFTAVSGIAQVPVLTQHNDLARTGQNLNESALNTSSVNVSGFGKLFWRTVDGQVYAQPLYVPSLLIGGKTRNVVYVATQHDSVYAFDADDPAQALPLWHVNLGTPVPSQDICIISGDTDPRDCPYLDINPEIGITSTPVIDSNAGVIYVVARTKASNSTYHFFLHALDIKSGNEQLGGPVEITGQVTGSGPGSSGGVLAFNPVFHLQRPSLLLMNGVVYVAFGAVGDIGTFHGWIMGYDATTLLQTTIFCVTPNGSDGGIWQSGQGLVADGLNNIYVMTGNGTFDANVSGKDYGDSVLKISTSSGLAVSDYFTPSNQANLFAHDTDLGSGGPLLLPGTSLVVGIGKDKLLRLVDSTNMGKFNSGFDGDVQEFTATLNAYLGSPVYWDSPNNGPVVYLWSPADLLTAYKLVGGMFQTTPASQSTVRNSTGFANTVPLSVSANGGLVGSGIVWAGAPSANASSVSAPGVLRAFDATNLGTELWDSMQNPARDDVGLYAKWVPPTVANGKVYLPSFSGQLLVYGLNPPPASGVRFVQAASATPGTATASVSASYSSAQAAGDLNVVIVSWTDATSTIQSVTDAMGNTYSLAIGPTTGTGLRQSVYYLKNIAAGTNSVTVAFNQAASAPDVRILEYSGVDTVSPLDVSVGASGSISVADSGSVVLGNANDLIIGANIVSTKNIVAGSPFTSRLLTSTTSNIVEDRVVNVAAGYDAWAPLLSAGPWVMQMVAFKAGSAITNPAPTVSLIAPTSGPTAGGTPLAITGTGFLPGATVSLGGTAATGAVVVSATSITATSPAHAAGAVDVVVTNTDGQTGTLSSGYTYTGANPAPTVTVITPNTGSTAGGAPVTITGTGFLPNATVSLGGTAATGVVVVSPTSITATTPAHAAGAVNVVVTNSDGQSSLPLTNGYTYIVPNPAPTVSTILPISGPTTGGTPVTITGTGFLPNATVSLGGTAATGVAVVSPTSITATTPAHAAGAVNVVVTNTDGQSSLPLTNGYTYTTVTGGTISFVQVAAATPQTPSMTVTITYPKAQTASNMNIVVVGWDDTTSAVNSVTDSAKNTYTLAVGPITGSGGLQSIYYARNIAPGSNTVTVAFTNAAAYPDIRVLEYSGLDTANPLDPLATAQAAGSVASANSGSATTTAANELIFGAGKTAGRFSAAGTGFTSRIITSPDGDLAEDKIVTATGSYNATAPVTSSWVMQMAAFRASGQGTTNPAPTVSTILPTSGPTTGGTPVTITGTGFLPNATVSLGGTAATGVVVVSPTSITATSPAHAAGAVNVVVTNSDGQSSLPLANGYTYIVPNPAPTVSTILPTSGPTTGGTPVTITGTGFLPSATVSLGGASATGVVVVSPTSITATSPAHAVGAVNVVVTNSDGQSSLPLTNGYTYTAVNPAPTVSTILPTSGPTTGGTPVTITGTGFLPSATVSLGGTSATGVVVVSPTSITATSPAHVAGAVNVVVTNSDGQSSLPLTNGYNYTNPAPTVTVITPNTGSTAGGASVTITGTGFLPSATVSLGGTAATGVVVVSPTSITATTPAHAAGAVNVVVTNSDGQSSLPLTNGYTYIVPNPAPTVSTILPISGPTTGGTPVTITGTGFLPNATVSLGGTAATGVAVVSPTSITATTPAHAAGAVNVVVTNTDGQSSLPLTNGYTYTTVTGGTISFVQVAAATPQTPSMTVTITYPKAQTASNMNIVVVGWDDTTSAVNSVTDSAKNTYTLAVGPITGSGGLQSIYYARNIAPGSNTVTVAFTNAAAYPDIRVLEYSGLDTANPLDPLATAQAAGSVASANSGSATTTAANELIFGAGKTAGRFSAAGTGFTSRIITSPDGDLAEDKIVTATGSYNATAPVTSSWVMQMAAFRASGQGTTNPAPTVSTILPTSGPTTGGTPVTITGTGFLPNATVSLGGTAATGVVVVSPTSITATSPAHAAGAVNVVVTNSDGQSSLPLANGYTYIVPNPAPTVSTILPTSGPTTGGTPVTITGTGFLPSATVSLGGASATGVVVVSPTSITATSPAHAVGAVNVVVTNSDGQSSLPLTNGYTYTAVNPAPTVSTILPTSGPTTGGTPVTITGTGFLPSATVSLGGASATGVVVVSPTSITATTPAHAAGAVNVIVTNSDGQSSLPLTNGYTYTSSTGGGPISFVQVAAATPRSPTASVPVTYAVAQTAGNLNIVVVGWNDTTSTVNSVTDSNLNQYTLAVGPTTGTGLQQSIYYARNIAPGGNTVTVAFSKAAVFADVRALEYSGLDTANPLDLPAAVGTAGTGSTANSGSATTATANDLIFGAGTTSGHFNGPGTGFTSRIITSPDGNIAEDKIVSSTGSYNAPAPANYSNWVMQMVAFKAQQ